MKRPSIILVFVVFFSISDGVYSAQPRLSKSPLSKLIAQPAITAIFRESSSFLWVGTQEGLYRFDGANLVVFNSDGNNENWIPSSHIIDISSDINGNVLVATYGGGLLIWDPVLRVFVTHPKFKSFDNTQITSLHVAKDGNIWISIRYGVLLYNPKADSLETWPHTPDISNSIDKPYSLLESDQGELLMGHTQGLSRISILEKAIKKIDLSSLNTQKTFGVSALALDLNGNLIIGTDTGHLAVFDLKENYIITQASLANGVSTFISDFSFYEDKLIIATDNGLYISDKDLSYMRNISLQGTGLSHSDILSLYQDGNHVWVGTYNGLDMLSSAPFELFNNKNSGVQNDILAFEQDSEGRMWIGTYAGLYLYDAETRSHIKFESVFSDIKLIDQRITTLAESKGKLWIGFYRGGVQVIDLASGSSEAPNIESANEILVMDIYINKADQNVWIATWAHGLIQMTNQSAHYHYDNGALKEEGISIIFGRKNSLILVSTSNKIYEYNIATGIFSPLEFDFGLGTEKAKVLSVAEAGNGDIWFGTKDHGLFQWPVAKQKLKALQLHHASMGNELEYSTVYGISFGKLGDLWCATQSGIFKLNPKGQPIKRFTLADGLQGNDFSFGASFTSRSGIIYFGGLNGYNRFDPSLVDIDISASPMLLTGISLPTQDSRDLGELTELKSLLLSHKDHFVTFQFSVLDFIDAEKNQFRYKLENFDTEWVENGTRNTATYTNLPAGDYTLQIQGANSAGIWNREGISLDVKVLPAPWYTWWAFLIYGIGFMIFVWGFLRIYRSYAIARESKQMALDMFEAENRADDEMQEQIELQDEIVQTSYEHNLTTLALVSDVISSRSASLSHDTRIKLTDGSIRRISALSSLEDCLSYQAGGAVANLQKYTNGIFPKLLNDAPVKPETIITINEVTTMPIPAELASPISIVIYELLENTIQHAFEQDSPANYIQIQLSAETSFDPYENFLHLSVSDSGIGVPEKIEELVSEDSGISIVLSIVANLGGTISFSGQTGTLVTIKIPYDL